MHLSCAVVRAALLASLLILPLPVAATLERLRKFQRTCFRDVLPCVMFSNERGSYGCAQCGDYIRQETVIEFQAYEDIRLFHTSRQSSRVLMMPEFLFFENSVLSGLLGATNIAAIIVYGGDVPNRYEDYVPDAPLPSPPLPDFSADYSEPNWRHNFYPDEKYQSDTLTDFPAQRNKGGSGLKFELYPFNIFRVSKEVAETIRNVSMRFINDGINPIIPQDTELTSVSPRYKIQSIGNMYSCPTETSAPVPTPTDPPVDDGQSGGNDVSKVTSEMCLNEGTCLPIGGHSIWSAAERINATIPNTERKILAITAPMDSMAFFPDLSLGASAEIASLAAQVAVAVAVSEYRRSSKGRDKPVLRIPVFFAWNAQAWGYSGSSRFLHDVLNFQCNKKANVEDLKSGCEDPNVPSIKFLDFRGSEFAFLHLGQLISPNAVDFFSQQRPKFKFYKQGLKNSGGGEVEEALDRVFKGRQIPGQQEVLDLSDGNRTLVPLDASQSVHRYFPNAESISITEYDQNFGNRYYHSMYDDETLNGGQGQDSHRRPLYEVAAAIADTVIAIAYNDTETKLKVNTGIINDVIRCMTVNWTTCSLATTYLGNSAEGTPKIVTPTNYASSFFPFQDLPNTHPSLSSKLALIRSIFVYHHNLTDLSSAPNCSTIKDCDAFREELNSNPENQSSLRTVFCSRSKCVESDTYTHDAFGTAINYSQRTEGEGEDGSAPKYVYNRNTDLSSFGIEGGWTESGWDRELGLCGFVEDTQLYGGIILGVSIVLFIIFLWVVRVFDRYMFKVPATAEEEAPILGREVPLPP